MLRVCVLLVSVCVLGAGSLSGRGFFCRDPDTGKLHPVNSTWLSSTFCGKYHCRLRRKNITATEYAPSREINITNIKLFSENFTKEDILPETSFDNKEEVEKIVITTEKKTEPDIIDKTHKSKIIPINQNMRIKIEKNIAEQNETERDRYLTETEIKSISEILHTVKKSDLDAIVEIYNLAQDIYKEIDNTSKDRVNEALLVEETIDNYKNKPAEIPRSVKKKNRVSYWYEPLSPGKVRPGDLLRTDNIIRTEVIRNDMIPVRPALSSDMEEQSSNMINLAYLTTIRPKPAPTRATLPPPPSNVRRMTASYFNGPLSHKDFGKLPYYYPISNFQKSSSYLHQQSKLPPKPVFKPITYKPQMHNGGVYQKEIKPSVLLPYPFSYIHHYNWTYPQSVNYNNKNVEQSKLRAKENIKTERNHFMPKIRKAVLMNPDLENFQDLEVKAMRDIQENTPLRTLVNKVREEKRRPEWQTDPIPNQILEEVRAHVQEKQRFLKPFQLRKKVNLERVGKLIKLEEMSRSKRSVGKNTDTSDDGPSKPEIYEVYIERTTCNSDYSVPGFFRYGNLSQPFPECCPQRIARR